MVYQLDSPLPGFLYQLKVRLNSHQYRSATVFVNHFRRLSYVHIQSNLTSKKTLKAKQDFEAYSQKQGVIIRRYHTYNERFFDNALIESVNIQGKTVYYCGVNDHFQNGIA